MKKILTIFTCCLLVLSAAATPIVAETCTSVEFTADDDDTVFEAVEQEAQFPGGQNALRNWINNNIDYPQTALDNEIQGTVHVKFVVKKDGSVGDVKVIRPVDPALDKEAVRVVKRLPKFQPGRKDGQAVNCYYTTPVTFRL